MPKSLEELMRPVRRDPGPQLSHPDVFAQPRQDEAQYRAWLQKTGVREDPTYDTYGAFKQGLKPDARGHLTDEFKLPTHPTFSVESRYNGKNGKQGGEWIALDPHETKWAFKASPWNMQNTPKQQMMEYFDRVEPGNTVQFPDGTSYTGQRRR